MKKQSFLLSVLEWVIILTTFIIVLTGGVQIMNEEYLIGIAVIIGALLNLCFGYAVFYILKNTFEIRKEMKLFEDE